MHRARHILLRVATALIFLYPCWLGMEATHELGHVLMAWRTGGEIESVSVPLIGTSQTIVEPNPFSRVVAWGGVQWGTMIPIFACMLALIFRRRVPEPLKFFTGFCLIANGTYLAVGTMWRVGDARDLLRMNVHPAELISVGAAQ